MRWSAKTAADASNTTEPSKLIYKLKSSCESKLAHTAQPRYVTDELLTRGQSAWVAPKTRDTHSPMP